MENKSRQTEPVRKDRANVANVNIWVNLGKSIRDLFSLFLKLFCKFKMVSKKERKKEDWPKIFRLIFEIKYIGKITKILYLILILPHRLIMS